MALDLSQAAAEMRRLSGLLDEGLSVLRKAGHDVALAEMEYRQAKAESWVTTPREDDEGKSVLAKEREAAVDADTADRRYKRDLADSLRQAALESVRSRRAQLSSLQSLLAAEREEMAMSRTGPRMEP